MKNNNDLAKTIGENIKVARKLKGLTQKQIAQTFFMTQQQYSRFENVLSFPDIKRGKIVNANCTLISASALRKAAVGKMKEDPYYFVDMK